MPQIKNTADSMIKMSLRNFTNYFTSFYLVCYSYVIKLLQINLKSYEFPKNFRRGVCKVSDLFLLDVDSEQKLCPILTTTHLEKATCLRRKREPWASLGRNRQDFKFRDFVDATQLYVIHTITF